VIKKLALLGIITLSLVGCANNNNNADTDQNDNAATEEEVSPDLTRDVEYYVDEKNTEGLIGRDINDLFEELDKPQRATYFVNSDDINIVNINSDETGNVVGDKSVVTEYVYPRIEEKKSALYVYTDKNTITEANVGEFAQVPNNDYRDTDYRVNYYFNNKAISDNNFDVKKYKDEFAGKNIDEFNKKYGLEDPKIEVFKKSTVDQISLYTRENSEKAILVHSKNNVIKDIKEVEQNLTKAQIDEYFGK
jgi:hypothetical protein